MDAHPRLISAAVFLTFLVMAGPAHAATNTTTVSMDSPGWTVRSTDINEQDQFSGGDNTIVVTQDPGGGLRIADTGQDVDNFVATAPCSLLESRTALCPAIPSNTADIEITPGGGNDTVIVDLPERNAAGVVHARVYGGYGADQIVGSSLDDTLEGDGKTGSGATALTSMAGQPDLGGPDWIEGRAGRDTISGQGNGDYLNGGQIGMVTAEPRGNTLDGGVGSDFFDAGATLGPDRFTGGAQSNNGISDLPRLVQTGPQALANQTLPDIRGGDTVSYGSRTFTTAGSAGVTADLDGVADDGATGEADQIDADIESLGGTIRNDTLTGSSAGNYMIAGLGVDTVRGGSSGADAFDIRDGVRDTCVQPGTDDRVDADLQDPTPEECSPAPRLILITSFTFNFKPVDETIPYVGIGSFKRKGADTLLTRVSCAREAKRACTGEVRVAKARGGKALGSRRFRLPPGRAAAVALKLPAARVAALRKDGGARVSTVSKGTSKKGPTTTQVQRRLK
jgi:hypothetical protein